MPSTTDTPTLTITLTARPPVRIVRDEWPLVASAAGQTKWSQVGTPEPDYEHDHYYLRVRRHEDGRTLVYGTVDAASSGWRRPAGGIDTAEGELLEDGDDIAAAIRRVGEEAGIPDHVIRAAIADLPAEAI